jgi:serine/threonine protein kinase
MIGRGMEIGGFRLDELVGEGGMGVVYKARQLDLDRIVALKLIQPGLSGDSEFRARFQRESRLAAAIDHPNIVPIYGAGEERGVYFISMRYVDGTDLGEYLRSRNSPLEPRAAARLISQVAGGLDAAHNAGLVHRDVKPANVLLDAGLHPYLTDFGLTKQVTSQSANTKTGIWIGSINYAAPEQIEGGTVDARTDVYALGCVLFEALTRRLPYDRDNDMALMYAKVHDQPVMPSTIDPELPPGFDDVVRRALSRRPEDRYPSAGDLGRAALAAAEGVTNATPERTVSRGAARGGGYEPTRDTPVYEPVTAAMATRRSRSRLGIGAGALAVIVLAALAAVALIASGSSSPKAHAKAGSGDSSGSEHAAKATASSASSESAASTEAPAANAESDAGEAEPTEGTVAGAPAEVIPLEPFHGRLYSAEVPAEWTPETVESRPSTYYESHWRDPEDPNTSVLIDSQIHHSDSTPIEDAEGVRGETSQSNGYREVAFEETTLQGLPAARWVFDVEEDRRVDYFVVSCGVGFGILGSTSPVDFGRWAPTFHAVANSVTGNCE